MPHGALYLLSAFTTTPDGGNPAGVWIGDRLPDAAEMQRIAKRVGFSETAFVAPREGTRRTVRYYSPEASLTSVEPRHVAAPADLLDDVLEALDWRATDLDAAIPPALAFAGAWHLVIPAATPERLARLDYDFDALKTLMLGADLTTVHLVWREQPDVFHARDPFPVGGVVEDPATGAAAAAFGGYLRDAQLVRTPASIVIRQGETMGRPSRLHVRIPAAGGIVVSGRAVEFEAAGG